MGIHTIIYFIGRILPGIINFVAIMFYTRLLSPEEYGEYSLVLVSVTILNTIIFQWLRMGLMRYYPSYSNKDYDKFLSSIGLIFLNLSGILIILFFLSSLFLLTQDSSLILILLLSLLLLLALAWNEINLTLLRSKLSPIQFSISSLFKALITFVVGLVLLKFGFGSTSLVFAMFLGASIPIILMTFKEWKLVKLKLADRTIINKLINYGLPLTLTFALSSILLGTDRWMLGTMVGNSEVGVYSVTYDFVQQSLFLLMTVVNLSTYPIILKKLEESGKSAAENELKKAFNLIMLISIPATVGLLIVTSNLVDVIFGSEYRDGAIKIMPIIVLTVFIQGIKTYYYDLSFQLGNKTKTQLIPVIFAAVINVILNLFLIPKFGAIGAGYASLIAYLFALVIGVFLGKKVFVLPFPKVDLIKILLCSIFMSLCVIPFSAIQGIFGLIIQVVIGIIAYIGSILIFNVVNLRVTIKNKMSNIK